MKEGEKKQERTGSPTHRNTVLPFIDRRTDHRVPNGWLFPMLAAFRASVAWNLEENKFTWIVPLKELLPAVIDDLVRMCVTEHRDNNMGPEWVGKRESAYRACYDQILLCLARSGHSV